MADANEPGLGIRATGEEPLGGVEGVGCNLEGTRREVDRDHLAAVSLLDLRAELAAWLDDAPEGAKVSCERTVRRLEREAGVLLVLDGLEKAQDTGVVWWRRSRRALLTTPSRTL